jgi:hypothetical protein
LAIIGLILFNLLNLMNQSLSIHLYIRILANTLGIKVLYLVHFDTTHDIETR